MSDSSSINLQFPEVEIVQVISQRDLRSIKRTHYTPYVELAVGESSNELIVKIKSSDPNFPNGKFYVVKVPQEMIDDVDKTMMKQIPRELGGDGTD